MHNGVKLDTDNLFVNTNPILLSLAIILLCCSSMS